MATEAQYKFFQKLYDEQSERRKNIQERSKLYFTVVSFYFGAILFRLQDIVKAQSIPRLEIIFGISSAVIISASLLFTLLAIRVRAYEVPCDPEKWIKNLGVNPQEDPDFFDARIVDYAVATNKNDKVNEVAATKIKVAGWLIFGAVSVQLIGLICIYVFG
ncbi:MAG: hypothetical protein JO251_03150 [Verrucomicrobia bacterium]|nr:hypothetical protein [Verrucomicrobiota bacterium]